MILFSNKSSEHNLSRFMIDSKTQEVKESTDSINYLIRPRLYQGATGTAHATKSDKTLITRQHPVAAATAFYFAKSR